MSALETNQPKFKKISSKHRNNRSLNHKRKPYYHECVVWKYHSQYHRRLPDIYIVCIIVYIVNDTDVKGLEAPRKIGPQDLKTAKKRQVREIR